MWTNDRRHTSSDRALLEKKKNYCAQKPGLEELGAPMRYRNWVVCGQ